MDAITGQKPTSGSGDLASGAAVTSRRSPRTSRERRRRPNALTRAVAVALANPTVVLQPDVPSTHLHTPYPGVQQGEPCLAGGARDDIAPRDPPVDNGRGGTSAHVQVYITTGAPTISCSTPNHLCTRRIRQLACEVAKCKSRWGTADQMQEEQRHPAPTRLHPRGGRTRGAGPIQHPTTGMAPHPAAPGSRPRTTSRPRSSCSSRRPP